MELLAAAVGLPVHTAGAKIPNLCVVVISLQLYKERQSLGKDKEDILHERL